MRPATAHRRRRRRACPGARAHCACPDAAWASRLRRPAAPARRAPGNALLEFVLTLPIIVFVAGLSIVMSLAMLSRQKALVDARYNLYRAAGNGWWSDMKLEGWDPSLSNPGAGGQNMPRGYGEELDRLYPEVAPPTLASTSNAKARDYWERIWDNLPGRHETHATKTFRRARMWQFIEPSAEADHFRDSSPWHFFHLDAWKIARSGPLREIFDAFYNNLQATAARHFEPTRKDIIDRWWHGTDILDDEANGGRAPSAAG